MSFSPDFTVDNFVPENYVIPDDPTQMQEFLKKTLENHARFINRKDMGQYETVEVQNNQTFPGDDPQTKNLIFRKIIDTGGLANTGTTAIAHNIMGINNNWSFTRVYGTAFDPVNLLWLSMPNGTVAQGIGLRVDATNINITTTANLTAFTTSTVVLEFYKG